MPITEIIKDNPPNILDIKKRFDLTGFTPVFMYGDTLYNPSGEYISEDLKVHEETHSKQQKQMGVNVWWETYLINDKFRLSQELEAYQEQYKSVSKYVDRSTRRQYLQIFANNLSSALYGHIVSKSEAKELIKNG